MMKGSIHQKDIIIINIYEPNIGTSKYIKQKQTAKRINSITIIVEKFEQCIDHPDNQ